MSGDDDCVYQIEIQTPITSTQIVNK